MEIYSLINERRVDGEYGIIIYDLEFDLQIIDWDRNQVEPCQEIQEWLKTEINDRHSIERMWIVFDRKEDAITFKMRWG